MGMVRAYDGIQGVHTVTVTTLVPTSDRIGQEASMRAAAAEAFDNSTPTKVLQPPVWEVRRALPLVAASRCIVAMASHQPKSRCDLRMTLVATLASTRVYGATSARASLG